MNGTARYILFADDDADDQELLLEAFATIDANLKVVIVSSGKEVISFMESKNDHQLPGLIILDYNIPDMNGARIIKLLCEHKRFVSIPMVVWSTSNSPHYRKICLEAGANNYFEKPQSFKAVLSLAKELMALVLG